jgi:hypothetical protein
LKIQSAGRLGNILFIWAYALNLSHNSKSKSVLVFADKYHSDINNELKDTFDKLSGYGVKFKVDNFLGLLLKIVDRVASKSPNSRKRIPAILRIQTEGVEKLNNKAWIQRGYFQNTVLHENLNDEIYRILKSILQDINIQSTLHQRMPSLRDEYQAIHIRMTDYFKFEFGVIEPQSQIQCLQKGLKLVICTDGAKEEVLKRINGLECEIITPAESNAWETLAILSGAKNLVITNSTLSWWSGFIASRDGNSVWAPSIWNGSDHNSNVSTLGPHKTYIPSFEKL